MAASKTHVYKITNVPVFLYGTLRLNDFDGGKSITRSIGRGGPSNGFARIKVIASLTALFFTPKG